RVVLALRADDLVDLELHQFVHDREPDADAEREQALPRCTDELAERLLDLRRQRPLSHSRGRDDRRAGYLPHGGSSCLGWTSTARNAAHGNGRDGRTATQTSTRFRTTSRQDPTHTAAAALRAEPSGPRHVDAR